MTDLNVKNINEDELNDKVQMLTKMKHFDSAAELIAAWVFWDEVKRELGVENPQGEDDDEITGREIGRGDMQREMSARITEEFGGWGPDMPGRPEREMHYD